MNQPVPKKIDRPLGPLADPASPKPSPAPPAQGASSAPRRADGSELPRRKRQSWGTRRLRLPQYQRPGFRVRVFNDIPGRIEEAENNDWVKVKDSDGNPIKVIVDRDVGTIGFLMEIPQEFYDEDFAKKQAVNDEIDFAMLNKVDGDKGYRPMVPGTNQPVTKAGVIRGREPG